ncbi:hypothetical protein IWW34DRAFT_348464 [Fusarium oxysporum f. sp. albedinis]|nr:hypothetical protein IWW34DRAFT_348464 [Fusarium oxysporum f. sp. albedinis]
MTAKFKWVISADPMALFSAPHHGVEKAAKTPRDRLPAVVVAEICSSFLYLRQAREAISQILLTHIHLMQNDECHHGSGRPLRLLGNAVTAGEFYRQNDIRSMRWDVVNSHSHLSELKLQCSLNQHTTRLSSIDRFSIEDELSLRELLWLYQVSQQGSDFRRLLRYLSDNMHWNTHEEFVTTCLVSIQRCQSHERDGLGE